MIKYQDGPDNIERKQSDPILVRAVSLRVITNKKKETLAKYPQEFRSKFD